MLKLGCIQRLKLQLAQKDKKKLLIILLFALPLSIILDWTNNRGFFLFIVSCLSIIPLAGILGGATEQVSIIIGPKAGGLLNATMGNIPELFICFFAVKAGLFSMVKASVAGSIIGNMLLVLGLCILFGGVRYKFQSFDKMTARINFGMLFLALIGLIIPAAFKYLTKNNDKGILSLSFGIALVFLIIYLLGLFFSFYTHRNVFIKSETSTTLEQSKGSIKKSIICLILVTAAIAYESNILVSSIEIISGLYNISETFLGIVVIPIIGNIAEYSSAMMMAMKDKINLSIEIAVGSGMQMALFVTPILILTSFFMGSPMNYVFSTLELITITCSIGLSLYIFQDGKTNWLEGVELLSAYTIMALAYLFMT